jgi:hypothetical protein
MESSAKKTILISILSVAGLLLLAALGWYLYFIFQFSVYTDDQYKFSIRYPKTWQVIVHPRDKVAVVFMRPKDTALDTMQENFNVTVQSVPNDILTLEAFTGTVKAQMTQVFGKSIKIVEDKPFHSGWHEGHMIAIDALKPDHLKLLNAWVLHSDQAYILTFLGDMNKYEQDALIVNEMIRSLQLQ